MAKRNEVGDLGSRFGGKGVRSMFGGMMDFDDFWPVKKQNMFKKMIWFLKI
jgi:hypothetical protein